jgi:hypothetical protein
LVIENAFNPCVINDYYNGKLTHRMYFNKKTKDIYKKTKCDVCVCTNCNNTGYVKCEECNGTGKFYDEY